MGTYVLGVAFAILVILAIVLGVRNSGMKERYASWWLVIALFVFVFSVFPESLTTLARIVGVAVPLNLGFFLAGIALLMMTIRQSIDLSKSGEERRRLAEEIALLQSRVDLLEVGQETNKS